MMSDTPFAQPLGDGLVLRSLHGDDDIDRLAAFHGSIHGPPLVDMSRVLMRDHPHAQARERWLYVEDSGSRRIVAGLCLIPWTLRYAGVTLRSGEMGIVGTEEAYRGRGLIRALCGRFDALLRAGGFDLSHIQGIPYFYRQFGYEYAMPLEAWCRVELHSIPADAAPPAYAFRRASAADLPDLMRRYEEASAPLDVSTVRDEAAWRFLLGPGLGIDTAGEPWMVVGPGGATAGYLRVMPSGFGDGLICGEASLLAADAALATLRWLVGLARERGKPYLRLNLPRAHVLNSLAMSYGAGGWTAYAWQIRLPDPAALLRKLAPALEGRIAGGPFAGLSRDLRIDMYRGAIVLRFVGGRLASVEQAAPGGPSDLRLPPQLLAPLLLGWRSLDELRHAYPDVIAGGASRLLAEALFPPMAAFLYSIY